MNFAAASLGMLGVACAPLSRLESETTEPDFAHTVDTTGCVPTQEICGDGVDQDCDGADLTPMEEVCDDGIDQDCDGADQERAPEICDDGIDQDCDGADLTPCELRFVETMTAALTTSDGLGVGMDALPGGVAAGSLSHVYVWKGPVVGVRLLDESEWVLASAFYGADVAAIGSAGDIAVMEYDGSDWPRFVGAYRYGAATPYLQMETEAQHWESPRGGLVDGRVTSTESTDIVFGGGAGELAVVVDATRVGTVLNGDEDARVTWDPEIDVASNVVVLGDTDGDGIDELGVSIDQGFGIFRGPLRGNIAFADADVVADADFWHGGTEVTPGGDLNGDGLADVVVDGVGVAVFAALDNQPLSESNAFATLPGDAAAQVGPAVSAIGDLNGDDHDDLAVYVWSDTWRPEVWLFRGPLTGALSESDSGQRLSSATSTAFLIAAVSDLDDDGFGDVLSKVNNDPFTYVVPGKVLWH